MFLAGLTIQKKNVGVDATSICSDTFFLGWQRKSLSANSRSNFLQYRILNKKAFCFTKGSNETNEPDRRRILRCEQQ